MDLRLHWPHWREDRIDWPAAAVSGFAAGAVLMTLELLWATFFVDGNPWKTSHSLAAILLGPTALTSDLFDAGIVTLALTVHYLLGIAFGMALGAALSAFLPGWGPLELVPAGALFGAALYLLDFYALAPVFPWFSQLRGMPAFTAHLIFGICAALFFWKLQRRGINR